MSKDLIAGLMRFFGSLGIFLMVPSEIVPMIVAFIGILVVALADPVSRALGED